MAKKVFQLTGGAQPMFSWRLPQEIAAYKQGKLQAQQWIHVINGFSQKGIKQSEIEDSGVAEWLQDQGKRQVTREELADLVSYRLPSIKEARLTGSDVKYRSYSFAGPGEDYNESLFYFPTVDEDLADRIADLDDRIAALNFDFDKLGEDPDAVFRLDKRRSALIAQQDEVASGITLRTHFSSDLQNMCPDARADFAHMRWSVKVVDGTRTLFVHEFQSDWAQKGRAYDWKGDYKRAPLVTETEHWTAFLLRRAMLLAVEQGCDQLTWISGASMANGGNAYGAAGLDEFYMKIVPSLAKKLAKPFQSELRLADFVLKDTPRRLAVMPVTPLMREKFSAGAPVYSYARVVEQATFDPVRAVQLEKALQLRADTSLGEDVHMRVSIVREVMSAHEDGRPAAELVGRTARIAFNAEDPVAALDHEGFHLVLDHHFSAREREDVQRQFAYGAPLLVRTVRLLLSHGEFDAAKQAMANWEEAAAHAYALWRKGQMPLSRMESLAQSVEAKAGASRILSKVFPKAQELVKSVCSWIRGSGVSPTDFLAKIVRAHKEGQLAGEQAAVAVDVHDATDARQRHRDDPYEIAPRADIPEQAFN
ncbi:hypothetical protein [Massilia orientalis]|uniref:Uncharacterized protein n=1 Tax=Massilia orientalis TaxID=3050128 RepID=A0ACC7MEB4_9BURK|nr:hypothetical protein [Massilia sp. YIM B02787]